MKTTKIIRVVIATMVLITATYLMPTSSFAQGNLQFNQVINLSFYGSATQFTVPAGKVWKIEAAVCNHGYINGNAGDRFYIYINGAVVYMRSQFVTSTNVSTDMLVNAFPIWFPTGTYGVAAYNSIDAYFPGGYLSVIEFNIVP